MNGIGIDETLAARIRTIAGVTAAMIEGTGYRDEQCLTVFIGAAHIRIVAGAAGSPVGDLHDGSADATVRAAQYATVAAVAAVVHDSMIKSIETYRETDSGCDPHEHEED